MDQVAENSLTIESKQELRLPKTFHYNALRLAKQYGEVRINYVRHNQAIAKYMASNEKDVLAVLSNDSDFLSFEGDFQFWKALGLKIKEMATIRFNRSALMSALQLNYKQIQLLASLTFGSFLQYNVMKKFYFQTRATGVTQSRFLHLVQYTRNQPVDYSQKDPHKMFNMRQICARIFGRNYTQFEMNAITNGFVELNLDFELPVSQMDMEPLIKLMKENNSFMYRLATDKVFLIKDIHFIDFREHQPKSYTELIMPLVRKMLGILYGNKKVKPKGRLVCMKHAHDEPFKVTEEIIVYPSKDQTMLFHCKSY